MMIMALMSGQFDNKVNIFSFGKFEIHVKTLYNIEQI